MPRCRCCGSSLFGQSKASFPFPCVLVVLTLRLQGCGSLLQGHATVDLVAIFCTYQRVVARRDGPMNVDGLDGARLRKDRPMREASTAYNINETWHFEDTASRGLDLARRRGAVVPESGRAN